MNDPCKSCGAAKCAAFDMCQCCGKCRNCGQTHLYSAPLVPVLPTIPQPFIPQRPTIPWDITWCGGHLRNDCTLAGLDYSYNPLMGGGTWQ